MGGRRYCTDKFRDENFSVYENVDKELREHAVRGVFKDTTVYCNCDYYDSAIVRWFIDHEKDCGYKSLCVRGFEPYSEFGKSFYGVYANGDWLYSTTDTKGGFISDNMGDPLSEYRTIHPDTKELEGKVIVVTYPPESKCKYFTDRLKAYKLDFILLLEEEQSIRWCGLIEHIVSGKVHPAYTRSKLCITAETSEGRTILPVKLRERRLPRVWYCSFPIDYEYRKKLISKATLSKDKERLENSKLYQEMSKEDKEKMFFVDFPVPLLDCSHMIVPDDYNGWFLPHRGFLYEFDPTEFEIVFIDFKKRLHNQMTPFFLIDGKTYWSYQKLQEYFNGFGKMSRHIDYIARRRNKMEQVIFL